MDNNEENEVSNFNSDNEDEIVEDENIQNNNIDIIVYNEDIYNSYLDKKCFRCRKNTPKHDVKIPIRKDSFLENIRINLITIYFLIFD